ncbi:PEGA domain-containing protein [bacterium]|nr:PEGA domain-containing protein [bacterium]
MKKIIIPILLIFITLIIILLALIFKDTNYSEIELTANIDFVTAKIEEKEYVLPTKIKLKNGKYQVTLKSDGYQEKNEEINVGKEKTHKFELLNSKDQFAEKELPIYSKSFNIEYNKATRSFSVLVKEEPFEENKNLALALLAKSGVTQDTDTIIISSVAGVNGAVGP